MINFHNVNSQVVDNILEPDGIKKYKEALEIYSNMAVFANSAMLMKLSMNLYYAFHVAIFNPTIFEDLKELEEIDLLHSKLTQVKPLNIKHTVLENPEIYQ